MRILFRVVLVVLSFVLFACGGASGITLDYLLAINPTASMEMSCDRVHGEQGELHLSVRKGDENVSYTEETPDRMIEAVKDPRAIITVYDADSAICAANAKANANRSTKQSTFQYGVVWTLSEPQLDLPRIRLPEETRVALESSLRTECRSAPASSSKNVLGQTVITTTVPELQMKKAQEWTDIVRRAFHGGVKEVVLCGPLGCKKINEMRSWAGSAPIKIEDAIDSPAVEFAEGALKAIPGAIAPGGAILTQTMIEQGVVPKGTRWEQAGKGLMEVGVGVGGMFIGADGAIIGGGMSLTGGGAVVGAPLCIGSLALAVNSAATFCNGIKTVTICLFRWEDAPSAPSSQPAQPAANPAPKPAAQPPAAQPPPAPAKPPVAAPAKPAVKPAAKPPQAAPAKPAQAAPAKPAQAQPAAQAQTTTTTNQSTVSWTTARKAYWKAHGQENGTAPQRSVRIRKNNGDRDIITETKELHHVVPQSKGGSHDPSNLRELWPTEHGAIDPSRHPGYTVLEVLEVFE